MCMGRDGPKQKNAFGGVVESLQAQAAWGSRVEKVAWINKALLAKLCWRLLTQDASLWCRVLRGKYFIGGLLQNKSWKRGGRPKSRVEWFGGLSC